MKGVTDKGSSVSVSLANGTELTADYVIVTVPLGVLKEGTIKFTPPLPAEKQTAIRNMVRGAVGMAAVHFHTVGHTTALCMLQTCCHHVCFSLKATEGTKLDRMPWLSGQ